MAISNWNGEQQSISPTVSVAIIVDWVVNASILTAFAVDAAAIAVLSLLLRLAQSRLFHDCCDAFETIIIAVIIVARSFFCLVFISFT